MINELIFVMFHDTFSFKIIQNISINTNLEHGFAFYFFYKEEETGATEKHLYPGEPHRMLLSFSLLLFLDSPASRGEWVLGKKGSNILDRKVSHKLGRETQF